MKEEATEEEIKVLMRIQQIVWKRDEIDNLKNKGKNEKMRIAPTNQR